MFDGIAFPLVKWPVMVALLAACKFDTVRAAYTWPFVAIAEVLIFAAAISLVIFLRLSLTLSVVLSLVLLVTFDAWVIGLQARRRFYRDTDGVLSWRAAWGLSVAGNLLTLLAILVVGALI